MGTLGKRIRKLRNRKGYELDKLAYLTGIDPEILMELEECDNITRMTIEHVMNIAEVLDSDIHFLLTGQDIAAEAIEEDSEDIEGDQEDSFISQIMTDDVLAYMHHYPVTFWSNLMRKLCKNNISPDGLCKLIDAVQTVKPEEGKNGNGKKS
jgi:transcriptional regulator with XRE-family HTH domain